VRRVSRLRTTTARAVRTLALVLAVVAMQVTLLGGGPGCPLLTGAASATRGTGTMAGMRMGGSTAAAHDVMTTRAHDDGGLPDDLPSDDAASKACTSMAPCFFALSLCAPACNSVERPTATSIGTHMLALTSVTTAPELPPPRA
jgi:hypothetical protein